MSHTDLTPEGQKQAEFRRAARAHSRRLKVQTTLFALAVLAVFLYELITDTEGLFIPAIIVAAVLGGAFQLWSTWRFNAANKEIWARYRAR